MTVEEIANATSTFLELRLAIVDQSAIPALQCETKLIHAELRRRKQEGR